MKIDILTIFPNMFNDFKNESIINRAIKSNKVNINIIDIREFSHLNNKQVDDTPYGGGSGMVLRIEPLYEALFSVLDEDAKVILLTPDGNVYKENIANTLSKEKHLIFICGHYEGVDERIRKFVDYEISIGDYILTGGELPTMVVCDSIIRLIDGVITKESLDIESFNDNLLDYPVYTKPREYKGMKVPEVLFSGNHEEIKKWQQEQRIKRTKERRPDLLK